MKTLGKLLSKGQNTVIPIMKGGIGNQLFIYSAAIAFQKKLSGSLQIDKYSGFGNFDTYNRSYSLPNYLKVNKSTINMHFDIPIARQLYRSVGNKLSFMPIVYQDKQLTEILVGSANMQPRPHSKIILDGYFQDWRIPYSVSDQLVAVFDNERIMRAKFLFSEFVEEPEISAAVHLRRFEHTLEELSFIKSYCDKLKSKYSNMGIEKFYIFSENQEIAQIARTVFGDRTTNLSLTVNSDIDEFFLISQFRNIAITESTFGWWAAWLGQKNGSTNSVVASKRSKIVGVSSWRPEVIVPRSWELI